VDWEVTVGGAGLRLSKPHQLFTIKEAYPKPYGEDWNSSSQAPFEIVAFANISITNPRSPEVYMGRSHSLWFGDVQTRGDYAWYETAFQETRHMHIPNWKWETGSQSHSPTRDGFYLPHEIHPHATGAVTAFGSQPVGLSVVWPFTRLLDTAMDDFIDRWVGWLASAAQGQLHRPSNIPERNPAGSWRTGGK
jgi:serine/threonine-protein kinase